ncbi:MAG: acyl-CoA dehydrogenase family protein, partial [Deltaproteobacteria bacterium]|nr:acyl-CoA dehydrogenase family protein [Deltaproteobacteria bacterium]
MDFTYSDKTQALISRLQAFMESEIYPNEAAVREQHALLSDRWDTPPLIEELKRKARDAGLWNLFLPESERGAGLTNLEYAPLCEIMG